MRGVGAVVLGAGPAHAFYFSTYEFTKEKLSEMKINDNINYSKRMARPHIAGVQTSKRLSSLILVLSASSATLIHDAISNPTEVIKQRLQMYDSPYKSVVECAKKVFQQEGISAFYRSYTTQLVMNLPYQAIHFSTYEFIQEAVCCLPFAVTVCLALSDPGFRIFAAEQRSKVFTDGACGGRRGCWSVRRCRHNAAGCLQDASQHTGNGDWVDARPQ